MTRLAVAPCPLMNELAARTAAAIGDRWAILSPHRGLLPPDAPLDPYDQTAVDPGPVNAHHVALQLATTWPGVNEVVALTPNPHTELLARACALARLRLVAPLAHPAGVGEQRGRLAALLRSPSVRSWSVTAR